MIPLVSDQKFEAISLIVIAIIGIIPATLGVYYARSAKKNSAEAKVNSAEALHEVRTNGGMTDPNPNLNDHVKYQTEMTEWLVRNFNKLDEKFDEHLKHSKLMDQALAEVYMAVRPQTREWPKDD